MQKEFPKNDLKCMADRDAIDGYTVIEDKIVDVSRWSIIHRMVFEHNGEYYETAYRRGATEMQDENPYEFDGDMVKCAKVIPVTKTIIAYEHVRGE